MSEIKAKDSAPTGDAGEEKDAAKAHFDNLKTNKPRPVSVTASTICVRDKYFPAHTFFNK